MNVSSDGPINEDSAEERSELTNNALNLFSNFEEQRKNNVPEFKEKERYCQ